ncbi:hypothetical protein Trydic_g3828 [Trypoxylus dichotomus]
MYDPYVSPCIHNGGGQLLSDDPVFTPDKHFRTTLYTQDLKGARDACDVCEVDVLPVLCIPLLCYEMLASRSEGSGGVADLIPTTSIALFVIILRVLCLGCRSRQDGYATAFLIERLTRVQCRLIELALLCDAIGFRKNPPNHLIDIFASRPVRLTKQRGIFAIAWLGGMEIAFDVLSANLIAIRDTFTVWVGGRMVLSSLLPQIPYLIYT